jgi:hypothetical protein
VAWNPRSSRDLILEGDGLAVEGRLQKAAGLYVGSVDILAKVSLPDPELNPERTVGIALSRALGHERLGLVRVWLGEPESAHHEFVEAESALRTSHAMIGRISRDQALIVEHVTVAAPLNWENAVRLERGRYDAPPSIDLAMGMKMCRHGWLSKNGQCRGHPPDPCL